MSVDIKDVYTAFNVYTKNLSQGEFAQLHTGSPVVYDIVINDETVYDDRLLLTKFKEDNAFTNFLQSCIKEIINKPAKTIFDLFMNVFSIANIYLDGVYYWNENEKFVTKYFKFKLNEVIDNKTIYSIFEDKSLFSDKLIWEIITKYADIIYKDIMSGKKSKTAYIDKHEDPVSYVGALWYDIKTEYGLNYLYSTFINNIIYKFQKEFRDVLYENNADTSITIPEQLLGRISRLLNGETEEIIRTFKI